MATQEQIKYVVDCLGEFCSHNLFDNLKDGKIGIDGAIKLLYESDVPLSAGEMSKKIGVSTARMAVLIKKMVEKGIAVKLVDKKDLRVTLVTLSQEGKKMAREMRESFLRRISVVIDKLGIEKIEKYLELTREIGSVFFENLSQSSFDDKS